MKTSDHAAETIATVAVTLFMIVLAALWFASLTHVLHAFEPAPPPPAAAHAE
ncbi:MAG: hypothetical protein JWM32_3128 [Verrucomicrobia bacterium]|nr:hypothetical protein [Verrucomicrobiota bacterium]